MRSSLDTETLVSSIQWIMRAPAKMPTLVVGSVADAGGAIAEEFDELCAADDHRARHEIVLIEAALLEAWRADENLAACFGKTLHQVLERREPFFMDVVGVTLLRQPRALDRQKHHHLLLGGDRRIGDDKGDGGLVGIVLGGGQADDEISGHLNLLLDRCVNFRNKDQVFIGRRVTPNRGASESRSFWMWDRDAAVRCD